MAFTYGFFNSIKSDRRYNAEQVSEIFDGILIDGIFGNIGQHFAVTTANNGMQINVGTGRAWFNHTWSKNDSVMVLTVGDSDISRDRYDTVVLEVNHEDSTRANSIHIVRGIPDTNPQKPILIVTDKVHQYPLAHILVKTGVSAIAAEDIENCIGLGECPFATGALQVTPIDNLWEQWKGEWETWFAGIKLQLSGDIVTNLQYQIDELKSSIRDKLDPLFTKFDGTSFQNKTYTHIITESMQWQNPYPSDLTVTVMLFGGGASAFQSAGGSGHMATSSVTISAREIVKITIGEGGSSSYAGNNNGGTTSFGTYVSANGGSIGTAGTVGTNGGNGGAGGGGNPGGNANVSNRVGGNGGNGSYGGGGGGGIGGSQANSGDGGKGGDGGIYGGGGGGGGASFATLGYYGGAGGQKGTNGGAGGAGGAGSPYGTNVVNNGLNGSPGINTSSMGLEFVGPGTAGAGGTAGFYQGHGATGGGGGGGGYGGNGGNGGSIISTGYGAGGGGGGGGYGGNGGPGGWQHAGGGGGYGGNGGYYLDSGVGVYPQGYGAGGGAAGGGGYGKTQIVNGDSGASGICIIRYTMKELIIN